MVNRSIFYYEARIIFGVTALLPSLALPIYAILGKLAWQHTTPTLDMFIQAFELTLPLAASLSVAHLMAVERDEGFDELRASYPEQSWRVPLLRTFGALVLASVSLILGILSFRVLYGDFDVMEVIVPALAPAVYLIGMALLASNLTQNYWASAAVVMVYWAAEFMGTQWLPRALYLFDKSAPMASVSYPVNRLLLLLIGVIFLLANGGIRVIQRRGMFVRGMQFGR